MTQSDDHGAPLRQGAGTPCCAASALSRHAPRPSRNERRAVESVAPRLGPLVDSRIPSMLDCLYCLRSLTVCGQACCPYNVLTAVSQAASGRLALLLPVSSRRRLPPRAFPIQERTAGGRISAVSPRSPGRSPCFSLTAITARLHADTGSSRSDLDSSAAAPAVRARTALHAPLIQERTAGG
jgi:hypothetical protein